MNRNVLVAAVAVLVVASIAAPTGLALDSSLESPTADATTLDRVDVDRFGSLQAEDGDPGSTGGDTGLEPHASRDDLSGSVAGDDSGPPTIAGPLRSKLPDGSSTTTTQDSAPSPSDGAPAEFSPAESVEIVVESDPGHSDAVVDAVSARGGEVRSTYAGRVAAELPAGAIEALARIDAVTHVREPETPVTQGTISEGVERMNATAVHDLGGTGENATIAVVDIEFNPENDKIADQVVATKDFSGSGFSSDTGLHGTASAEAVADVAPDANLILVSIATGSDLVDAADYLESETDADAVTMSLGWYPTVGPLDGTDYLSQRINESTERGLVWVTSAGNQGEYGPNGGYGKHYDKRWTPHENRTDYMDFGVVDGWDTALPFHNSYGGSIYVSWYEDTSDTETYNVVLYGEDSDGNLVHLKNSSTTRPYEKLSVGSSYDPLYIEIENVSAQERHHIDVHTRGHVWASPAYNVTRSTLVPATSSDVITVAAVDQYDDHIAPYSSRGPTVDGRQGIDVAAPTNVSQLERSSFTGTSAAAPHVGGLAGLLAGADSTATVAALRLAIEDSGRPVSGDGAVLTDDTSTLSIGSGHVDALAALEALDATGNLTGTVTSAVTGDPIENATVSVSSGDRLIETTTTSNASYHVTLATGVYDLEATATDYQPGTLEDVSVETNATGTANVSVLPENGTLSGTVTDSSGDPIEGATVGLDSVSVAPAETDENGTYVLENVPAEAERVLDVRKRAYHANTSVNATLAANGSAVRNATLDQRARYLGVDAVDAPADVEVDDAFEVTATVVNLGTENWTDSVAYRVDGDRRANETVPLNATNATQVRFDDAIGSDGSYELSVGTANESPAVGITVEAPTGGGLSIPASTSEPDVSVLSADVATDPPIEPGDRIAVDVRLHNAGDADGSIDLVLTADGGAVASTTAHVPAGSTADATLATTFDEPGTYALAVEGEAAGTVDVRAPVEAVPESANETAADEAASGGSAADAPADETPGFGVVAALVAVLVGALAACRAR